MRPTGGAPERGVSHPEQILAAGPGAAGWVVRFEHLGDRYGHRIFWRDAEGDELLLLESVEGIAGDVAPPSPPLQQLHLQNIGGQPVALAVGMAGRLHWSSSMALAADGLSHGDPCTRLLIEQAASGGGPRRQLGNRWRMGPQVQVVGNHPPGVGLSGPLVLQIAGSQRRFQLELPGGTGELKLLGGEDSGQVGFAEVVPEPVESDRQPSCWGLLLVEIGSAGR